MNKCTPQNRVQNLLPASLADVDSLVNHFFTGHVRAAATSSWGGATSVYEADDRLHLEVDAPGATADHVDVQVENGQLAITLERATGEDAPKYLYNERRFGKLTRTLDLPDTVDPETVEAELNAGVLRVSIAKRPETKPRRIEVRQA